MTGTGGPLTYLLLHGGGHGGWCWQRLARVLRGRGHEVWTPTLTGFGERAHLAAVNGGEVPFETFVTDLVNVLEFEDLRDVVLVGHSMGGVIVPRVAEAVPGRVRQVVWLAAPVLADGETLIEAVPQSPALARAVTINDDGSIETDQAVMVEAILCEGTDADRAWVLERHRPYPTAALYEPGRLSAFLELGIPTGYVAGTRDLSIPRELARGFADRLPGVRWAEVAADHDCMVSRPEDTAAALAEVAA